jgi:hypothetical protein
LLEAAATRSVYLTAPTPSVTVHLPSEAWWNTSLVGGFLAATAGVASALLLGVIDRRAQRRRMVQALGTELSILQFRMISACVTVARRRGRIDPDLLLKLKARITGGPPTRDLKVVGSMIDLLMTFSPPELAAWQAPPPGPQRGLSLRRYDLPYLESGLARIDLLRVDTQGLLLQARGALDLFNQQVDEVMRYHWLTFEPIEAQNRPVVEGNIERLHDHIIRAGLHVVNCVAVVLEQEDFRRLVPLQAQVEELPPDLEVKKAVPTG